MTDTGTKLLCPEGFLASAASAGLKRSGRSDLALVVAPRCISAAGVFTTNRACAAPVRLSQEHLRATGGKIRAVLINSGCANAATGDEGRRRAVRTLDALSAELDVAREEILVASTGVIGEQLRHDLVIEKTPELVAGCSADALGDLAGAIMTTDAFQKTCSATIEYEGRLCNVVGVAKGAGMVHPDMATVIVLLLTDAEITPTNLDSMLREAVEHSFHRISVDGDTSTNDTVFALASGAAGAFPQDELQSAFSSVSKTLAELIVRDGEGAQRLLRVRVREASSKTEALQIAKTVAGSLLVRTAVAGGDPNWGRIIAAVGRSGVDLDPDTVSIAASNEMLFRDGAPVALSEETRAEIFASDEVVLDIALGRGSQSEEFLTCDLNEKYVRFNALYTT